MGKANLYSLFFAVPAGILLTSAYLLFWGKTGIVDARVTISRNYFLSIVMVLLGILLHELIHGLSWAWFGKKPLSTIKYGINLKALAPYAHCNQPLDVRVYRLGALMPGVLLGLLQAFLGIIRVRVKSGFLVCSLQWLPGEIPWFCGCCEGKNQMCR
jgi:hypothetical protein